MGEKQIPAKVVWHNALPANRSEIYSAFNFMQACPPTPYSRCEKVVQLEGNVTGLSADTRLGFELLIAADYQAAKASLGAWKPANLTEMDRFIL